MECNFNSQIACNLRDLSAGEVLASGMSGPDGGIVGMDQPGVKSRTRRKAVTTSMSRRIPFAQQVAERLRDLIVRGDLPPGGRIIERAVCEQLSVSRTPLREALKLLEVEGLVEISQNKGARIMSFTPTEANNLFEVI